MGPFKLLLIWQMCTVALCNDSNHVPPFKGCMTDYGDAKHMRVNPDRGKGRVLSAFYQIRKWWWRKDNECWAHVWPVVTSYICCHLRGIIKLSKALARNRWQLKACSCGHYQCFFVFSDLCWHCNSHTRTWLYVAMHVLCECELWCKPHIACCIQVWWKYLCKHKTK